MFNDNIQYEVEIAFTLIPSTSPGNKKLIPSKTYSGRELINLLGEVTDLTNFVNTDRVKKNNKLSSIMEMVLNLDELDNSDNLEDG